MAFYSCLDCIFLYFSPCIIWENGNILGKILRATHRKWIVQPGQNLNSYEIVCVSWLSASFLKIQSKMNKISPKQQFCGEHATTVTDTTITRISITRMRNRYQYRLFSLKHIYVKYKNVILSLIDSFFRIWKDKKYGRVLFQILNYYGETRSQDRTNQISGKVNVYLSHFSMCRKSNLYVTK